MDHKYLIFDFFSFDIAGIIFFTSSEYYLIQHYEDLRPKIPILGLNLNIFLNSLFKVLIFLLLIFF